MTASLATGEQIRLILWLRWRLFRNSLRTLRGRLDAVGSVVLWLMMGGLMLGGGAVIFFASYSYAIHGQASQLAVFFWAVFLFWQLYPIFAGVKGAQFEFAHLLRFPLRYGSFFMLSLVYGLSDPSAVGALFWLLCLSAAVGMARPALFLWVLAVSLVFAAMNLLLARAVSTWADRWMARRRTREILGAAIVVVILATQALPLLSDWGPGKHIAERWIPALLAAARALPPAFAGRAVAGGLTASWMAALAAFLFVCLYTVAFFWLLHSRLVAQYRGENLSEARLAAAPRAARPAARRPLAGSWPLPWQSSPIAAVFEREGRYALRNWQLLLQLLLPAFFVVVLGPGIKHGAFFLRHPGMAFPIAVAYAFLTQINREFNSLGYDGTGIRFLFLAPVPFRQVMIGKNLFQAVATLANVLLIWICVRWIFGPVTTLVVLATLAAMLYAFLASVAVGNVVSVCFPGRLEFDTFRRGRSQTGVSFVASLATQAVVIGSGAIVFLVGSLLDRMSLALLIFFVLAAFAAVGYLFSLGQIDRIALNHRESLVNELCRARSSS